MRASWSDGANAWGWIGPDDPLFKYRTSCTDKRQNGSRRWSGVYKGGEPGFSPSRFVTNSQGGSDYIGGMFEFINGHWVYKGSGSGGSSGGQLTDWQRVGSSDFECVGSWQQFRDIITAGVSGK